MNNIRLSAVTIALMVAVPYTSHAKEQYLDSTPEPVTITNAVRNNSKIINTQKYRLTFDGTYGSTPAELIDMSDGFCYIESIERSSLSEELKLDIKDGKYVIYGTLDGKTPAVTGIKGTVACAVYEGAPDATVRQIGDPTAEIMCDPSMCSAVSVVDYGEKATASITFSSRLNCPAETCGNGRFEINETEGSNSVPGTSRVETSLIEPGEKVKTGNVKLKLYNHADMLIDAKDQPYVLRTVVKEPKLFFTCNGDDKCDVSTVSDYGQTAEAKASLSAIYKNCVDCKVNLTRVSGNIGFNPGAQEQVISATQSKHDIGESERSGVIRADLVDRNGRIMDTASVNVSLSAKIKQPIFNVSCSPSGCSQDMQESFGTTSTATATVNASFSDCVGCSVRFTNRSGHKLVGSGNSRSLTVSQPGSKEGKATKAAEVLVQLMDSYGNKVSHVTKNLSVSAEVERKIVLVKPTYKCLKGTKEGDMCVEEFEEASTPKCQSGYTLYGYKSGFGWFNSWEKGRCIDNRKRVLKCHRYGNGNWASYHDYRRFGYTGMSAKCVHEKSGKLNGTLMNPNYFKPGTKRKAAYYVFSDYLPNSRCGDFHDICEYRYKEPSFTCKKGFEPISQYGTPGGWEKCLRTVKSKPAAFCDLGFEFKNGMCQEIVEPAENQWQCGYAEAGYDATSKTGYSTGNSVIIESVRYKDTPLKSVFYVGAADKVINVDSGDLFKTPDGKYSTGRLVNKYVEGLNVSSPYLPGVTVWTYELCVNKK